MQQLAERSGQPKTTIHHYVREELLPPARKTAPNAAIYDDTHLERLHLIARLRGEEFGELSIPEIRRVLAHVESGRSVPAAVRLAAAGVEPAGSGDGGWRTIEDLATAADLDPAFVATVASAGLLPTGGGRDLAAGDVLVSRAAAAVCSEGLIDPSDLTPLADLLREVGHYSSTLLDVHAGGDGATAGGEDGEDPGRLRARLAALCDALLWRALRG